MEGCACSMVCPCALTGGFGDHCNGASALVLSSARYLGKDLGAVKLVWAGEAGKWSYLYFDALAEQREAAAAFTKAFFAIMGKIEAVKNASVDLSGKAGAYKLTIDGGRVLELTTEPVLGLDQKTPISHSNTFIPWSPTVMQARTVKARFQDGDRSFTLGGSNGFFNETMNSSGTLSA